MMLSLPNCGTDWLCEMLARCSGLAYFRKEFFNPMTNQKCPLLERAFGCELVSCYRHIAAPLNHGIADKIYHQEWLRSGCNFDKEVYSACHVDWFAQRFEVVVMTRPETGVFPPSRLRVWQWYDAMWRSLVDAGGERVQAASPDLQVRCRLAYRSLVDKLLQSARDLHLPIIDYQVLIVGSQSEIADMLSCAMRNRLDIDRATAAILRSRRSIPKQLPPCDSAFVH